jgi:hypothetical protein
MPVNPYLPASSIAALLKSADCRLLVSGGRVSDVGSEVAALCPTIKHHVLKDEERLSMRLHGLSGKSGRLSEVDLEQVKIKTECQVIEDPGSFLHSTSVTLSLPLRGTNR